MRLLLLSDVHANFPALEAVLADASGHFDEAAHLGDALGYGPHPAEVLRVLRELEEEVPTRFLLGNHEALALRLYRGEAAGGDLVSEALRWQLPRLSTADLDWVSRWPDGQDDERLSLRLRHGTPSTLDTYLSTLSAARDAFQLWTGRLACVGHTHLPAAYSALQAPVGEWVKHQAFVGQGHLQLSADIRYILNPGSVGQPRDGNPQASYAILDTQSRHFQVRRVTYDVAATQADIRRAGLPEVLATRLAVGH